VSIDNRAVGRQNRVRVCMNILHQDDCMALRLGCYLNVNSNSSTRHLFSFVMCW